MLLSISFSVDSKPYDIYHVFVYTSQLFLRKFLINTKLKLLNIINLFWFVIGLTGLNKNFTNFIMWSKFARKYYLYFSPVPCCLPPLPLRPTCIFAVVSWSAYLWQVRQSHVTKNFKIQKTPPINALWGKKIVAVATAL